MTKKIILIFLLFIAATPVFAEKIPVKIAPVQVISTNHDEVEVGDLIKFEVINDVYSNGHLLINKDAPALGLVDFVHPNGWADDKAEIYINKFILEDINNKKHEASSHLKIETALGAKPTIKELFVFYVLGLFRGAEIFVEPDTKIYNIFIEK